MTRTSGSRSATVSQLIWGPLVVGVVEGVLHAEFPGDDARRPPAAARQVGRLGVGEPVEDGGAGGVDAVGGLADTGAELGDQLLAALGGDAEDAGEVAYFGVDAVHGEGAGADAVAVLGVVLGRAVGG